MNFCEDKLNLHEGRLILEGSKKAYVTRNPSWEFVCKHVPNGFLKSDNERV